MKLPPIEVWLVEDDDDVRQTLLQTLLLSDIKARGFARAEQALQALMPEAPVVVLSDVRMPGMDGLALLQQLQQRDAELPVLLLTGHGDIPMAVAAMRLGAQDFFEKPYEPEQLLHSLRRAMDKRALVLENRRLRQQLAANQGQPLLLGHTPQIEQLRRQIDNIADTNASVLILGETGTGKEMVARSLHQGSGRKGHFVALNCTALPESIFESEMFGAEPGAFTGVTKRRIGKIEHANGGTLFLDEIEGMPLALQAKMLRVLQESVLERLGGNKLIEVDARVVAATKLDLLTASEAGLFRADLYFRLNVVTLYLPPLRERRADIPLLFLHFVEQAKAQYNREVPAPSDHLLQQLLKRNWPGNVRELRHHAEQYVLGVLPSQENEVRLSLPQQLAELEQQLIQAAMARADGNVALAAERLGIPRKTLYDKLAKYRHHAAGESW
ncbi:sigma-54-dependent transcriptional regulator [Zobellella iuensis]|uniref:Sigma-54-dependent Fis family transcriptional regulator n=1 Tax=Zobellella iuensis TaxID=2803811 RepID=A0ABS1QRY0_9GAMM|nr:sigma-54 dependent transcriptional regulator [Zobellella iuensis]MBL1377541.1 sigma-54-dependent Fis family transcriptional regulator [Zobellella iuensis]